MVIAVVAMRMMQMAVDKIIDVITMRNRFVPAARPVDVVFVVAAAVVFRGAGRWIGFRDRQLVLLNTAIGVLVMQVTVVQVIDVPLMLDAGVLAVRAVLVVMVGVQVSHDDCPQ